MEDAEKEDEENESENDKILEESSSRNISIMGKSNDKSGIGLIEKSGLFQKTPKWDDEYK